MGGGERNAQRTEQDNNESTDDRTSYTQNKVSTSIYTNRLNGQGSAGEGSEDQTAYIDDFTTGPSQLPCPCARPGNYLKYSKSCCADLTRMYNFDMAGGLAVGLAGMWNRIDGSWGYFLFFIFLAILGSNETETAYSTSRSS